MRYGVGKWFSESKFWAACHAATGSGMSSPYVISSSMYLFRSVRCSAGYLLTLTLTGLDFMISLKFIGDILAGPEFSMVAWIRSCYVGEMMSNHSLCLSTNLRLFSFSTHSSNSYNMLSSKSSPKFFTFCLVLHLIWSEYPPSWNIDS